MQGGGNTGRGTSNFRGSSTNMGGTSGTMGGGMGMRGNMMSGGGVMRGNLPTMMGMPAMPAMGMGMNMGMGKSESLTGRMGLANAAMGQPMNRQFTVTRTSGVLQVDMPGAEGSVPMTVTRPHVTTPSTAKASHDRRKQPANFACPVPGCGSTFTRHFNLKGESVVPVQS